MRWVTGPTGLVVPADGFVPFKPYEPPPLPPVRVVYTVTLRDTRDGAVLSIEDDWTGTSRTWRTPADRDDSVRFYWEQNDGSCDCNRSRRMYPNDRTKWLPCNGPQVIELVGVQPMETEQPC